MSVNRSIDSLATDTITVTRRAASTYVDGIEVKGTTSTLTIRAVVQPAFNLNRVIGGSNLAGHIDGQSANDVRQLHTRTELFALTPGNAPDLLTFQGADWTVARVELWNLRGKKHYHCVVTKVTEGAS